MARLSQGILGGISGKIGNLVGSSWKGIAVIKTKALSVANPRTAGQIAQRDAMSSIVAFATVVLATIIKPLNDRFAQGMSGFNLFVSRNIAFFDGTGLVNWASLTISKGKMVAVMPSGLVADKSLGTAVVSYPTTLPDNYSQATDKVYLLVYNDTQGTLSANGGGAVRSAGSISAALPQDSQIGDTIWVYIAFLRSDGSVASDTGYATGAVVA